MTSFFLSPPHVHFNTWLNGQTVDPFAEEGETPLWLHGNDPKPYHEDNQRTEPLDADSLFDSQAVQAGIDNCLDPNLRRMLNGFGWLPERAAHLIYQRNYRPSKFRSFETVYSQEHERVPHLTLPFHSRDVSGLLAD